ncbi:zinc finger protein OZF-like [Strongylocentrotus purpuratus]|uniref:C2H2-type domain-containing protein n=1 Tax=Strongylocentrotus purpuratus TaxID=7668 RepID=A0A7M7PWF0_STRPU|nr:zinc finger protein OZF-like [Strongylocentrotus purpuratus]
MDPPHQAFNHSDHPSYRISTGEYTGRHAQTNVGSLAHVEHIPQTIAPAAQHTHASGMPYVVPWGEHQFQPKNETTFKEESDSHQHVAKVDAHDQEWPDEKSPIPSSKPKVKSKEETLPLDLAEEEVVSNFVPLSWTKNSKPHTISKSEDDVKNCDSTENKRAKDQKAEEELAAIHAFMSVEPSGFTCIQCGHVVHRSQLAKHIRMHTADRPFKCDVCKRAFRQKSNLIVHMRMHTGELPFKCDFCDKAFRQKSILVTHVRTHTREMPYKCHLCPKAFTQKSNLVEHIRVHTGEKPYRCPECDKAFAQKSNLVVHIRSHTGEAPFKCGACAKSFRQKSILTTHMRTHTGELPFKCQQCERAFAQKSNLVEHERQHTGERPFVCLECDKAFIRHQDLLQHMRQHTGRKPYDCGECGKMFSRKKHAEKHVRSHIKHHFNCGVCGQGFMDENLMVIHLTTHCHCHICGISFNSKEDLTEHCRLHAMGMPDSEEVQAKVQHSKATVTQNSHTSSQVPYVDRSSDYASTSKSLENKQPDSLNTNTVSPPSSHQTAH